MENLNFENKEQFPVLLIIKTLKEKIFVKYFYRGRIPINILEFHLERIKYTSESKCFFQYHIY